MVKCYLATQSIISAQMKFLDISARSTRRVQNQSYSAGSILNQSDMVLESSLNTNSLKATSWCAMTASGLIGPFFF